MSFCLRRCGGLLVMVMLSTLAACGSVSLFPSDGPKESKPAKAASPITGFGPWVTVNADRSGTSITLRPGQELYVRLRSDPTSGYAWVLVEPAASVIAAVGAPTFERDAMAATANAAVGDQVWRFKAKQAGSATLRFESRRARELQADPAAQAVYPITVGP